MAPRCPLSFAALDAAPAAFPIGRAAEGNCGHSRMARYTGSSAYRQVDSLRKPTFACKGSVMAAAVDHAAFGCSAESVPV